MAPVRVLVFVVLVSAAVAGLFALEIAHGDRGADLIVVLDGGAARLARADAFRQQLHPHPYEQLLIRCPRTPPPPQPMPELLQGHDTATQIIALADWLRRRQAPMPQRLWIATDLEHTARATLLARIALAGRGIQIQPDPPPPPQPRRARQAPPRRPAAHALALYRQHRRRSGAPDCCPQKGELWGVGL